MEENRKLVFDERVRKNEEVRVKRFKAITIFITLIMCTLSIVYGMYSYTKLKSKSEYYCRVAKQAWYNGVEEIKYSELNIRILDDSIENIDIYARGINSIEYDKVRISLCIKNTFNIIQKGNTITINNNTKNIATLTFNEEKVKIMDRSKPISIFWTSILIFFSISICVISIKVYICNGERRMIIDMNKFLYNSNNL